MDGNKKSQRGCSERIYCFPYGPLYSVPLSCTVIGLVFYHIAAFSCKSFQVVQPIDDDDYIEEFGYWSYNDITKCVSLTKDEVNGIFKLGRFIGILGALISWLIFVALVTASFFKYPYRKTVFMTVSVMMGLLSFFSFLLLFAIAEDKSLSLAAGGVLAILAAIVWASGAVSICFCMKEHPRVPTSSSSKLSASGLNNDKTESNPDKEDP